MAVGCADCGAEQRIVGLAPNTVALCRRCGRLLDQSQQAGLTIGLAWTLAILLLLLPANLLPLMHVSLQNEVRSGYIASGITALWAEHWPLLALMFLAFTIVFPFFHALSMLTVLTAIHTRHRPRWLGRLFRYAQATRLWAMPDVLILAGMVIYMRTTVQLQSQVAWGGWCLIAVGILSILTPYCFSEHRIWRAIMPDRPEPKDEPAISCDTCNLVLPLSMERKRCPRCRRRLHERRLNVMNRTAALVIASYVFYFPAYYYPMSYSIQPNGIQQHTIIGGVTELYQAGFWELAAIIFTASVLIPMFKLIGLSWLLMSVHFPSKRHLVLRTRLYRIIHRIGRWSNTDPFIIALMVPLMSFTGVVSVHVGKAALPFALVVTLTMLASRCFDARLMWDAAEGRL